MSDHAHTHMQTFLWMCRNHDLTFDYSDDRECRNRGNENLRKLVTFAHNSLEPKAAADIWNYVVNEKLAEGYQEPFYKKAEYFRP